MYIDNVTAVPSAVLQNPQLNTPPELAEKMQLLEMLHYDFSGRVRSGKIIMHKMVMPDIRLFFDVAFSLRFPIHSVRTVNEFAWNDKKSCRANNSSGHNMRHMVIDGETKLSKHAIGCAFDINPLQNPCLILEETPDKNGDRKELARIPERGVYDKTVPGTLHEEHPLVRMLTNFGWAWGGTWNYPKDYQHFQIVPPALAHYVK